MSALEHTKPPDLIGYGGEPRQVIWCSVCLGRGYVCGERADSPPWCEPSSRSLGEAR